MNEFESDWISLSQSQEWSESVFEWILEKITRCVWIQDGSVWIQHGRIQDGCNHQVESEWIKWSFFCAKWLNTKMAEFKMAAIIKLSENEWIWVRLNQFESESGMEWECFWVNLREDNKVFESKMAVSDSNMAEFKMSCNHQVESEWTSEVFFVQNGWIQDGRIQDGCHHQVQSEWMSEVFLCK